MSGAALGPAGPAVASGSAVGAGRARVGGARSAARMGGTAETVRRFGPAPYSVPSNSM